MDGLTFAAVPLVVATVGGTATSRSRALLLSLSFVLGLALCFTALGATAALTTSSTTTIDGSNLFASNGGHLDLLSAASYVQLPGNLTTIQASGTGSRKNRPNTPGGNADNDNYNGTNRRYDADN